MSYKTEEDYLFEIFVEYGIFTEDEVNLCTKGWGWNLDTAETMLYVRTGLRNLKQLCKDLGIDNPME